MRSVKIIFGGILLFVIIYSFKTNRHLNLILNADPADSLEAAPGLSVKLFAQEPMLVNPTNMDIDDKGRVWICEVINYRPEQNPDMQERKAGDRILILEDTNADGKADFQKVFYQGNDINAALGIVVLGNQVIVSVSPNVFIFTDTDGDDIADKKDVLFTGIGGEQSDHGMHAFVAGPDGKLYFNFGNAGKQLFDKNGKPVTDQTGNIVSDNSNLYRDGMVLRCDPDGSNVEVMAHNFRNNYEVTVDSYGTLWQSDNDDDGNRAVRINYIMQYGNFGFKDELTGASWRAPRTNMEEEIPQRHWHQNDPGVVPNLLITGAGSPTGILVYEGNLLPVVFRGQVIHADAGPNVVRAYPVTETGAGYTADSVNIVKNKMDKRFRPSDICVAPDGSLFIADWYDPGVGGHRMRDIDNGRIYRVAPPAAAYRFTRPDYTTAAGAVEALKNPNMAMRWNAYQSLRKMGAKAEKALATVFNKEKDSHIRARALWLLSRLEGKKRKKYLDKAIKDKDADIRLTAIRAAQEAKADLIPYLAAAAKDVSAKVRREAAIHLRYTNSPKASAIWAELANRHDGNDRWYIEALGIGAERQWDVFFTAWYNTYGQDIDQKKNRDIIWRARARAAMPLLAKIISSPNAGKKEMPRYFRAFDFYPASAEKQQILAGLLNKPHPLQLQINTLALAHLDPAGTENNTAVQQALTQVLDHTKGQLDFVRLVERFKIRHYDRDLLSLIVKEPGSVAGLEASKLLLAHNPALLAELFDKSSESETESVLTALGGYVYAETRGQSLLEVLLMNNKRSLKIRKSALNLLARNPAGEERMIRLLEEKKLAGELRQAVIERLSKSLTASTRKAIAPYLGVLPVAEKPIPSIDKLTALNGNAAKGKEVFAISCGVCHKVNKTGADFGPELSEIGAKLPKSALYDAILYTDAGISLGYEGYAFKLKDGNTLEGIIGSETREKIDIKFPGGAVLSYPKTEIISKEKLNRSLMTPGLYESMSETELVNLVEYLTTLKQASK